MPAPTTRRAALVRVELVRERGLSYPADAIVGGPGDVASAARAVIGPLDREALCAVYLNQKNRVQAVEIIALGAQNQVIVTAREVFRGAMLSGAIGIVLAHQHPSGDPTPSPEDLALTRGLMNAGEVVGIRVLDHVVLGEGRHVSLRETTALWAGATFHQ